MFKDLSTSLILFDQNRLKTDSLTGLQPTQRTTPFADDPKKDELLMSFGLYWDFLRTIPVDLFLATVQFVVHSNQKVECAYYHAV